MAAQALLCIALVLLTAAVPSTGGTTPGQQFKPTGASSTVNVGVRRLQQLLVPTWDEPVSCPTIQIENLCNNETFQIVIAQSVPRVHDTWITKGWYSVAPNQTNVNIPLGDGPDSYVYIKSVSDNATIAPSCSRRSPGGNWRQFCVANKSFEFTESNDQGVAVGNMTDAIVSSMETFGPMVGSAADIQYMPCDEAGGSPRRFFRICDSSCTFPLGGEACIPLIRPPSPPEPPTTGELPASPANATTGPQAAAAATPSSPVPPAPAATAHGPPPTATTVSPAGGPSAPRPPASLVPGTANTSSTAAAAGRPVSAGVPVSSPAAEGGAVVSPAAGAQENNTWFGGTSVTWQDIAAAAAGNATAGSTPRG